MKQEIQELANLALAEYDASKSFFTQIQSERNTALKYYMQMAQGNEVSGSSVFVTSDVRDTVDWALSQLMEMFLTGGAPVRFNPVNAQDVEQADLETKYTQHVLLEECEGFTLFNTWFKDALISKNGVIKAYWEDRFDEIPEDYNSIGYDEFLLLVNDEEYEIKKVKVESDELNGEFDLNDFSAVVQSLGEIGVILLQTARFEVKGVRSKDCSGIKVENVAPERFFISTSHLGFNLDKCDYCAELMLVSRNELIAQGYDYEMVMAFPMSNFVQDTNDSITRYIKEQGNVTGGSFNRSGDLVEVIEHYIRQSTDKNPKLWCIKTVGNEVIDYEEVDKVPFHVITPKINPYRFYGDSLADEVIDIQYARTNAFRATMDNLKYSVSPRTWTKGDVDLEALNDYIPSGNVPCGADGEINTLTTPFVAGAALEISAYLEQMRAERTGYSKDTAGLDPSALANSTNMMGSAILNLSALKTKMIASTFANTGVKSLYLHMRELMLKHERRDKLFALNGQFVTLKPRSWIKSRSTTVKTGLGHAGKLEATSALNNILSLQEKLVGLQGGAFGDFIMPENIYKAISRSLEMVGVLDVDSFFKNPQGAMPPEPQPSPQDKQTEAYLQVEQYKTDKKAETDVLKIETDAAVKVFEINQNTISKNKELTFEYQKSIIEQNEKISESMGKRLERVDRSALEGEKIKTQREIEGAKIAADLTKHRIDKKLSASLDVAMTDTDLNPEGSVVMKAFEGMSKTFESAVSKLEEGQKLTAREQKELNKALIDKLSKPKKKRLIKDMDGSPIGVEEFE